MPLARVVEKKLGQILVEADRLQPAKLEEALRQQEASGAPLGAILVQRGFVTEDDVTFALGMQFNLAVVDLSALEINMQAVERVPESMARKLRVLPIFLLDKELTVAFADPTEIGSVDILKRETRCAVQPVLAPAAQVAAYQDLYYAELRKKQSSAGGAAAGGEASQLDMLRAAVKEAPIVKIVDQILQQAVSEGASDIHLEPVEQGLLLRLRIDGVLREVTTLAEALKPAVVSRLKVLSELDIAERQRPQDGRLQTQIAGRDLEFRVSVLPTYLGEKVVLRVLDRGSVLLDLEQLGLSPRNLETVKQMIRRPHGIILVTGPTGSGKSTTLYTVLNALRSPRVNILTVEDPVEYQLPGINQVQVNVKKGLTFASVLRAMLRQDPNIIMVGEIRDRETGVIAVEAALTGHLVFTTLHTNDAPGAITRLVEMGIDRFLIGPALVGVVAQRLVRRVCRSCRELYEPPASELARLDLGGVAQPLTFARGRGCADCKQQGYRGRLGIHEVLAVDDSMRLLISEGASPSALKAYALEQGFTDLRIDGMRKAAVHLTSLEEVLRVTMDE